MIRPVITLRRKRILIDVDTQRDLFIADGKACVRNHRRVLANIRRVVAWARRDQVNMISTAQIHDPHDHGEPYCLTGTEGMEKVRYTVRNQHLTFMADGSTDFPRDSLKKYDQLILYKRCENPFEEPRAERILTETNATEFIVIGGPTETAVLATVLGLLVRKKNVTVLTDAIGAHNKEAAEVALRKMQAKGAKLVDSKTLLGNSHLRMVHACTCDRCRGKLQKEAI